MKSSLNPCLIQDTIRFVLAWMETMRKAFIIYEEDFDLCIETLPLCISLAKAQGLMKRCEQWEVKRLLSFIPILLLLIQPTLRPYFSLGYHGTKTLLSNLALAS